MQDLHQLQKALKQQQILPLYCFVGDETFLIEEARERVVETALAGSERDFNLDTFYASETEAERICDAIETLPMMAQRRVVVVKEVHLLKEKAQEQMLRLIEDPVPTTTLVLIGQKVDRRKKIFRLLGDKEALIEFKRPFENQVPEWIEYMARKFALTFDGEARRLLFQMVGSNLSELQNEIRKLSQYLQVSTDKTTEAVRVTVDHVMKVVSYARLDSVFDLTNAIADCDRARALLCLANLLDHGQNEVGILSMMTRHIRLIRDVQSGTRDGLNMQAMSTRLGIPQFFLRQYQQQSQNWNDRKIEQTFQALLDTDRALKSSPLSAHIWLENFIIRTCVS